MYASRLTGLKDAKLFGNISINGVVGFRPKEVSFRYEPNKQQWQYEISIQGISNQYVYLMVEKQVLNAGNFPAYRQAFPLKRIQVAKTIYVKVNSLKGLSYINGSVKVPSNEAPTLDGNLSLLLVGHLVPNYYETHDKYPLDFHDKLVELQHMLDFKHEAVWLINTRTGQILSKTWSIYRLI